MRIQSKGFIHILATVAALCLLSSSSQADIVCVWCGDGTIKKYDASGTIVPFTTTNLSGWNGPVGLTFDNVGNLYAGTPSLSIIVKFTPNGTGFLFGWPTS